MFASALVLILLAGTVESWLWSSSSSSSRKCFGFSVDPVVKCGLGLERL